MNAIPINKKIIFKFIDKYVDKSFNNVTTWGFIVRNKVEDIKMCRWGEVIELSSIVRAQYGGIKYILIEPFMWTEQFRYNDILCSATSAEKLVATSNSLPTNYF